MSHVCPHELCSPAFDAPHAPALACLCPSGQPGQNFPISNEILGTSLAVRSLFRPVELRRHSPMASGKPATSHARRCTESWSLISRGVRHKRKSPLDFPCAQLSPRAKATSLQTRNCPLSCLCYAISKSFVKGISPVAPEAPNPPQFRRQGPCRLSTGRPPVERGLPPGRPRLCTGRRPPLDRPPRACQDKVGAPRCITA